MTDGSVRRVGGWCAIGVAVAYVVAAALYFVAPAGLRSNEAPLYWRAVIDYPQLAVAGSWVIAVSGILGLGAVAAISAFVRSTNAGWVNWMQNLALMGFALTAVSSARQATVTYDRAARFFCGECTVEDNFRKIIDVTQQLVPLDPGGLFTFGGIGLWVLTVSTLALRGHAFPATISAIGIALAAAYFVAVISNLTGADPLRTIAFAVGAILALAWYGWIGMELRRAS